MFDTKNKRKIKPSQQKIFIIGASVASLVATGSDPTSLVTEDGLITSGDVAGIATSGNDVISTGDSGGIISSGAGTDIITGGAAIDVISGGAGADDINGGAGFDNLVVIGITVDAGYVIEDLQNVAGTGIDLSALLSLDQVNNHEISDVEPGESIDGGEDGAMLYTFGIVDFTDVTLANITSVYMDNLVSISDLSLQGLISTGLTSLIGKGSIQALSGQLDLDGVDVAPEIDILDADGNLITPEFTSNASIDVAENSQDVGIFNVSDASAVGDVSYALSGDDAALFNLDASTGEIEFKAAPDFEAISGAFSITITATDEHEKSTDQNVTITVTNVNEAVSFDAASRTVNVAENQTIAATATATDIDGESLTYSLSGGDEALFNIDASTGEISFKAAPDFEATTAGFNLVVTASDGSLTATQNLTINLTNVNEAVSFAEADIEISVAENQTIVTTAIATDIDGDTLTYSLSGDDEALFNIDASTGEISFKAAPDFEATSAAFNVVVTVSDGNLNASQTLTINLTNVNEAVSFAEADIEISVAENQTIVTTAIATDIDGDTLAYSLSGDDEALFNINASTGEISFKTAPDFEAITTAFNVVVTASDGSLTASQNLTINLTNVNEAVSFAEADIEVSVAENQSAVATIAATDIDGDTLSYSFSGNNADESLFNLDANTGVITFIAAPDFEASTAPYNLTVIASDGSLSASQNITINLTDVNEAPEFTTAATLQVNVAENQTSVATVAATDIEGDDITYSLSGDDEALFTINSSTGEINFISPEDFENPTNSNQQYSVTVGATDGNLTTNRDVEVTVTDVGATIDPAAPTLTVPSIQRYGTEAIVNTLTSNIQADSSVASLANGGYIVVWETKNQNDDNSYDHNIHAQRYDDFGTAVGDEFLINSYTDQNQQRPKVMGLDDGGFVVAWQTYIDTTGPEPFEISARVFNADGVAAEPDFLVNVGDYFVSTPSIAKLADGGFVITWNSYEQDGDDGGIIGRIFNADASAQTDDIQINSTTEKNQIDSQITPLADGGFIVAWNSWEQDGSRMGSYFQKFDSAGEPVGDETRVNLTTEFYQGEVSIAAFADGGFVTIWLDNNASGSNSGPFDLKGNIYDADGTVVLSEFAINQYTDDDQKSPVVTVLTDGSFVVAWESDEQDGDGYGVYARHFKADGTALGDELLINSTTNGAQYEIAITALNNGGFVVTWTSNDGSDLGVYSQVFTGNSYRFEADKSYDFNILAALPDGQTGFTLSDVTISNIADGMSFTDENGDAVGTLVDDALTLSAAQLVGLKIKLDSNFAADVDLTISVTSEDSAGVHTQTNLIIAVDMVQAPEFNNDEVQTFNIDENITNVGIISATDAENQTLTYALTGADAYLFTIDSATGEVAFIAAEDYENPTDVDNQYDITVNAIDTEGLVTTKTVLVNSIDINEAPEFASDDTYLVYTPDGRTDVATLVATDIDGDDLSYSLTGSADDSLFTIDETGKIDFAAIPVLADYPDEIFNITVTASDAELSDSRNVEIHLTDYDAPTLFVANEMTRSGSETPLSSVEDINYNDIAIAGLSDGSYVVTWVIQSENGTYGNYGVYGQKFAYNGDKIGDEFHVNTHTDDTQDAPAVTALENGAFVVAWSSSDQATNDSQQDVYGQMFDGTGAATGNEFLINTTTAAVQENTSVSALSNGGFIVVWNGRDAGGKGVLGQRYDAAGNTDGDEFLINTEETNRQDVPDVTGLSDGGFVTVWQSAGSQDGGGTGIFAQKYDAAGDVDGVEFQVNSYTTSEQRSPSVAALADGGFVMVWQSISQDTSNEGVYGQIYDADGTVGSEFLINSEIASIQDDADVTALDDGGFVVTWNSYNQDGSSFGIYGQRYDADGNAAGQEFQANSTTSGSQNEPAITSTQDGGFIVAWTGYNSETGVYNIFSQTYETSPIYKLKVGTTADFDIVALVQPDQDDVLGEVIISGVPDYISFTNSTDNNDGSWTINQLDGLQIISASGNFGITELTLSVSSLDNSTNDVNATTTSQISISVGGTISATNQGDSPLIFSVSNIKHFDGLGGNDILGLISDDIVDYSFETIGNDILMTNASDNGFLLHSVEKIDHALNGGGGAVTDIVDLYSVLETDMTQAEYNIWLTNSYGYDIV